MRRGIVALISVVMIGVVLAGSPVSPVEAQSRSLVWERWDVVIDNVDTTNNRFDVSEIYEIAFDGTFRFGSAVIPDDNLEAISDVSVSQDGQVMTASCSGQAGTYCVEQVVEGTSITYHFFAPITDDSANFTINYTVEGALRVYEGGDQLWWIAIPEEHFGFPILSSTITVEMPQGYGPREGIDPVATWGAPSEVRVNGPIVRATATRTIGGNEAFEIRVQYPHDPEARVSDWQAEFDAQRDYDENLRPLVDLILIIIGLLLALGGPLGVFALWYNRGRDPKVGPVPEYLSEPPGDLPPAVVGTLVDERADVRDVISTLINLGHRGYLVMEENREEGGLFGIGASSDFVFKRTDKALDDLRGFERKIMDRVFGSRMERELESLKNQFYKYIPGLKDDLYEELVKEGLFTARPSTTRGIYTTIGVVILGLGVFLGFLSIGAMDAVSTMIICPPAALVFTGVAAAVAGQYMPRKTRKGAEAAAKWEAFREWLNNLEKYDQVESASQHFDDYLAYAIAFGHDRTWIRRFSKLDTTPIPTWYWPTYYGPYRGGYVAGTPLSRGRGLPSSDDVLPGELARAGGDGGFSLDDMAGNISGGLESISSGLTTMLESASRTLTSQPQSSGSSGSWGSGGSGWSGGGFSGGGGSGGGSRGFG